MPNTVSYIIRLARALSIDSFVLGLNLIMTQPNACDDGKRDSEGIAPEPTDPAIVCCANCSKVIQEFLVANKSNRAPLQLKNLIGPLDSGAAQANVPADTESTTPEETSRRTEEPVTPGMVCIWTRTDRGKSPNYSAKFLEQMTTSTNGKKPTESCSASQ